MNDDQLMTLVASGDKEAFTALVKRYSALLHGFCRRNMSRMEQCVDADDLVQMVFERAWSSAKSFKANVKAWLLTIARNLITDQRRIHMRRTAIARRVDDVSDNGEDEIGLVAAVAVYEDDDHAGLSELAAKALDILNQRERFVVVSRVYNGMSVKEVAAEIGMSAQTVSTIYSTAMRAMAGALEPAVA